MMPLCSYGDLHEGGRKACPSEKALATVNVSSKGLPKEFPACRQARISRQYVARNTMIYRDWLQAEDKQAEIELLAEKWGLHIGSICTLLDDMKDGNRPFYAPMVAEVTVLRQVKTEEVLRDGMEHRTELDAQIEKYEQLREAGEELLVVEQTDDENEKLGLSVKSKKLPIDTILAELYATRLKSQESEARALSQYVPRPVQEHSGHIDLQIVPPDTVFKEEFDRMQKLQKVELEAEVVEE